MFKLVKRRLWEWGLSHPRIQHIYFKYPPRSLSRAWWPPGSTMGRWQQAAKGVERLSLRTARRSTTSNQGYYCFSHNIKMPAEGGDSRSSAMGNLFKEKRLNGELNWLLQLPQPVSARGFEHLILILSADICSFTWKPHPIGHSGLHGTLNWELHLAASTSPVNLCQMFVKPLTWCYLSSTLSTELVQTLIRTTVFSRGEGQGNVEIS